ncbi:glycoside hydrolase family 28 protein [Roseinatronobacter alkalisoli]|uniref:Glycoside hydrolase family 28 protein n=1 Tax=Roseinatronobacter alkalisoli TaxID=3028235 RepID=A0ABT5TDI6_9RHOB|nr:glycoside hydrolase family 28 protein [Roseinatronobacter sp. HJB301]MDD7972227.1 glycoside hydrolase family 28 protein [Roseinatronobacter sp. HJB301]
MPPLIELVAITPRAVALRLLMPDARYYLPEPVAWRLHGDGIDRQGTTDRVVTVLHDLPPATTLSFDAAGFAPFEVTLPPCNGAVVLNDPAQAQVLLDGLPDGGTLIVPAGEWVVAPLLIPSHRHIWLADGARLVAPSDRAAFPILPAGQGGSWEGLPDACYRAILTAIDAHDITISGPGLVDGGGAHGDWWDWPKETRNNARRARLLHLIGCEGVTILGPVLTNSPSWTVHPYMCRNLSFAGLTIRNPADSPNTDGLNPESCEAVRIDGVRFSTGDDCIAIKAGKRSDTGGDAHLMPTRNVTVRNCLMERGHGGVVIGSEMSGGVSDVRISDCEMVQTDRGLRIKTRRGRGGVVSGIHLRNVSFDGVDTVLAINMHYFCDHDGHTPFVQTRQPQRVDDLTPQIRDITLDRIVARDVRLAFAACLGLPEAPVTGVVVTDADVTFAPAPTPQVPLMADGLRAVAGAGVLTEHCAISAPTDLPQGPLTLKDFQPC